MDEIDIDKVTSFSYLFFIGVFTLLSLTLFLKDILLKVSIISLQLILASFSIIGSSILVIITVFDQVNKEYNLRIQVRKTIDIHRILERRLDEEAKKVRDRIKSIKNMQKI